MIDETHELDRLAGQLFQGVLTPEMLPEAIASLAAWLQPKSGNESAEEGGDGGPPFLLPVEQRWQSG